VIFFGIEGTREIAFGGTSVTLVEFLLLGIVVIFATFGVIFCLFMLHFARQNRTLLLQNLEGARTIKAMADLQAQAFAKLEAQRRASDRVLQEARKGQDTG
jgi:hypothetical protein